MRNLLLLLTLTACGGGRHAKPPDTVYGETVADPATVPDFAAVNHDGTPRSKADLMGHPTVVWFFPVAGTPG